MFRPLVALVSVSTFALAQTNQSPPQEDRWGLAVEARGGGAVLVGATLHGAIEGRYHLLRWLSIGARLGGGALLSPVSNQSPTPLTSIEATLRFQSRIVFATVVGGTWLLPLTSRLLPYVGTQGGFVIWRFTLGLELGMIVAPVGPLPVLQGCVGFRIL